MTGEDKEEKPAYMTEWPLKRGVGRMEIRDSRFWEKQLDDLLTRDPEHFPRPAGHRRRPPWGGQPTATP